VNEDQVEPRRTSHLLRARSPSGDVNHLTSGFLFGMRGVHQDGPRLGGHGFRANHFRLQPAPRACYADPAMASPERLLVPETELSRPALVLAQRFVQRWDLYAHQLDDGSYVCVHEPLNVGHLLDHLRGEITPGAYLLDQDSQAKQLYIIAGRSNLQPRPTWSRYRPAFPR